MTRGSFGGTGSSLVYTTSPLTGEPILNMSGIVYIVYTDAAATVPANIAIPAGSLISGSRLIVTALSQLPAFLGPDTNPMTYVLYARPEVGGDIVMIYVNGGVPGPKGDSGDTIINNNGGGGGGGDAGLVQARGDLLVGTGPGALDRLAISTDPNAALVPNPNAPGGLSWGTIIVRSQ